MTGPSRHNCHHATTSTAPTQPHPNTMPPSPPVTASTAPPPTSAMSTGILTPPRQARDGDTYTGTVSTHTTATILPRCHCPDMVTTTTPICYDPHQHASMPPHWCRLDSAATAMTSDCHFDMAATRFNPIDTVTTTSTPPYCCCPVMVTATTPIATTMRHCHSCPLQHLAPIV
ncbi:hypothetical protein EDB89DRAFT_1907596 [Lactarius sanguifluus]|nr:hypothetical protein EDB89DRAFT_1912649 [Lactarius sanguifluus]KAH9170632.1 hypothetical protein EDB89DRAFT_1907596 [Lactarius sanguifluus]